MLWDVQIIGIIWERWPNFHFITMPGNLVFPVHPFTPSVLLTENILKILQFCCKEPDTKQLEKDQSFPVILTIAITDPSLYDFSRAFDGARAHGFRAFLCYLYLLFGWTGNVCLYIWIYQYGIPGVYFNILTCTHLFILLLKWCFIKSILANTH